MTEEQAILLDKLKTNLHTLQQHYSSLKNEYDNLLESNENLTIELDELRNKHSEIAKNHELLKISKSFSGSDEEKKNMKKKIGLMVREIDKCIELLNE